jgi:hypothetical protein
MLDNDITGALEDLVFAEEVDYFGRKSTVELKSGGKDIKVRGVHVGGQEVGGWVGGQGWVLLAEDGGESVHVVSRSLYLLYCCSLVLGLTPPVYCLVLPGTAPQVTNDNKREYVNLVARHRMTTAIRPQIHAFLAGFWEIVPRKLIR